MPEQKVPGGGLFGQIAVKQRFVTEMGLQECLEEQKRLVGQGQTKRIGDVLVQKGFLTEDQRKVIIEMQTKAMGPKIYGGFELIQKIAEGGMGAVYRAKQVSLDRIVALKLLPERFAKDETFVARFYREAKVAARLDHPHIVRALDVGEAEGRHYFAMEFVEGKSLGDVLDEEGILPEPRVVNYMLQIARALEHAWEHQLIHRDIKPDNILIAKGDVAKLADLGLARSTIDESTRVTQTGTAMGTPHYISPEQAKGEADIDIRTDIYSLGATMYHLVTGSPPYEGTTAAVIVTKHLTEEPPSARETNPQVSETVDLIIRKMMAKKREDRYATPTELIRDLEAVAKGGGEALGMTLMDASQLQFAREAPVKDVEAARRAPTQPTIVQAGPGAAVWGAIIGGGVVLAAGAVALVIFLSGPSKERVRAARTELGVIDALMKDEKWPDAKMRAAEAIENFKDVEDLLPQFESRLTTADRKAKDLSRLLAEAATEKARIETLMQSGDWETAHRRAKEATRRFAKLDEMLAVFASFAETAGAQAEKAKEREVRTARAERAMEEAQKLAARGKLLEAIAMVKELREEYADLPVGRRLGELLHNLEQSLQQKYSAVFDEGTKAFAEKQYEQASLHMREALKLRPDSTAAKSWLRNAENQLELDKAKALIRDGDAILGRKDYVGAAAKYGEAMAAFARLAARGVGPEAEQGKSEAAAKRNEALALRQCTDLLDRALALEKTGDWEGARSLYLEASKCAPGELMDEVARRKRAAEDEVEFDKAMRAARANILASRWKEATMACERALAKKPTSAEAKRLLTKAKQEGLKEKGHDEIERITALIESRRYAEAMAAAQGAVAKYPNSPHLAEFRRLAEKAGQLRDNEMRTSITKELDGQINAVRDEIARLRSEERFKTGSELEQIRRKLGEAEGRLRHLEREAARPVAQKEPPAGTSVVGPAGIEFVYVPGGSFSMGSESGEADERPAQRIVVDGFYMSRSETTNAQYERYDATHAQLRSTWSRGDSDPVAHVTWYDAGRFCRWLVSKDREGTLYRLPTEAEWEYAARGADGRAYPWGSSSRPSGGSVGCNYKDDARADGHRFCSPAGSFPSGASPFGCMDMAGNVWEWCLSWYSSDFYYSIPRRNPVGPASGEFKVVRGGSWNNPLPTCRTSNRAPLKPTIRNANTGFRVIRIERN